MTIRSLAQEKSDREAREKYLKNRTREEGRGEIKDVNKRNNWGGLSCK